MAPSSCASRSIRATADSRRPRFTGAADPRILQYSHVLRRRNPIERNDEARLEHGSTVHYAVWSDLHRPAPDKLRAMSGSLPPGFHVYLQLPEEITPRTRALARTIT